jgi:hypothetical protein
VRATALRTASAVQESRARLLAGRDRLMALPVAVVLGTAIGLQWIFVVGLAVVVRHHGWIYYQGGDQLWYYTGGWALTHGQLVQPLVGYLWSALLAPVAAVAGPNLANAYPAIIVFDVVILLPAALLALYGTARLIAGRAFAYGTLVVWLALPLVGIRFADAGYHQRFTELILPQAYGLTAMADFPTMVAAIVSAYFCARVLFLTRPDLLDAAAAGIAAGAAIAIKPSTALFLAGPLLACSAPPLCSWSPCCRPSSPSHSGSTEATGICPSCIRPQACAWPPARRSSPCMFRSTRTSTGVTSPRSSTSSESTSGAVG